MLRPGRFEFPVTPIRLGDLQRKDNGGVPCPLPFEAEIHGTGLTRKYLGLFWGCLPFQGGFGQNASAPYQG